jgi:hypothetical protein
LRRFGGRVLALIDQAAQAERDTAANAAKLNELTKSVRHPRRRRRRGINLSFIRSFICGAATTA